MIASNRSPKPRQRARDGFSAIEFMIIAVVLGAGVTTLYGMFQKTSEEAFRSKFAYLAAHAAREELEAVRTLNLFGKNGSDPYAGHDWRPLGGTMLVDIEDGSLGSRTEFQYPPEYSRIETRLEIEGDPANRMFEVTVFVRYQAKGSDHYGLQTPDGESKAIGTFRTLIVNRDKR